MTDKTKELLFTIFCVCGGVFALIFLLLLMALLGILCMQEYRKLHMTPAELAQVEKAEHE